MDGVEHISFYYQVASQDDYLTGLFWYADHRAQLQVLAADLGLPLENIAAAAAILSSNVHWTDLLAYLPDFAAGGDRMPGFPLNREKARLALAGDLSQVRGPKIEAFYDNLVYPESERVTIDRWAWRAWAGDPTAPAPQGRYIAARYNRIEADYRALAGAVDLQPYQVQAIIWQSVRKIGG